MTANGAFRPFRVDVVSVLDPFFDAMRMEKVLLIARQGRYQIVGSVLLHADDAFVLGAELAESALGEFDSGEISQDFL